MAAGGSGMIGSAISGALSAKSVRENRIFQAKMSNTSYQRSMADMALAGLNPILAYKQGGASTPSGNVATFPSDMTGGAAGTALSVKKGAKELSVMDAQRLKLGQDKITSATMAGLNIAATAARNAETKRTNLLAESAELSLTRQRMEEKFWADNPTLFNAKMIAESIGPAVGILGGAAAGAVTGTRGRRMPKLPNKPHGQNRGGPLAPSFNRANKRKHEPRAPKPPNAPRYERNPYR